MNLNKYTVLAHMGYFDAECSKKYKENSLEVCKLANKKEYIDIIELDVRKSSDGVIYCYHGNLWQYFITLRIPRKFSELQKKYNVDSLASILKVISNNKSVFLDIKDETISQDDIIPVFKNHKFKEVILGNKSIQYMNNFKNMPSNFVKILNGNIFCNLCNISKLKQNNYKYFEVVFPFQINKSIIEKVELYGLESRASGLFFFWKKHYQRTINKYSIKYISSDFL